MFKFYKYHGTGNDFILINNFEANSFPQLNSDTIAHLCHRRFGIGADGLMTIERSDTADFKMEYFNSDGKVSSMCGNGGRCISHLFINLYPKYGRSIRFEAIDGYHNATLKEDENVQLSMNEPGFIEQNENNDFILNTGSPHYVRFVHSEKDLEKIVDFGRSIRYSKTYVNDGINVNMVFIKNNLLEMATYERGVEDETYSCGTGVVAAALSYSKLKSATGPVTVKTKGGELSVRFEEHGHSFNNIFLTGPAEKVFEGVMMPNLIGL